VEAGPGEEGGLISQPAHHLYAELFKSMTGIQLTHVPYKGSPSAVADIIAGHVPIHFSDPATSLPLIRDGKLRALGVTTAARMPSAPAIPPIAETGVAGFDVSSWIMIVAPTKTPKEIVAKLHVELKNIAQLPEIQRQVVNLGMIPISSPSPEDLQRFIESEIIRWGKVVRQAGIAGSE
jgi:tripartite-type tricarboxylate transporter receptor subunit TctC